MKLASYRDGSRDGQLIVVSRDLSIAHYASGIAGRLQQVLDDWNFISPQLEELSQTLNHGKARHAFAFDPALCMAPLPRAFQHVVGRATDGAPALGQRSGDALSGAHEAIAPIDDETGFDAGFAVVTGDLARSSTPETTLEGIRLLMLASETAGLCAFGPVAVTPEELGSAWHGGQVHLAIDFRVNGRRVDSGAAGEARPRFGELIAALCRTRAVRAGSIVACRGDAPRGVLTAGDRLCIEVKAGDGGSVFGTIDQHLAAKHDAVQSP